MAETQAPESSRKRTLRLRLFGGIRRQKPRKKPTRSIDHLNEYVQRLVSGDPAPGAILAESYIAELGNADRQQKRWRRIYYDMRGLVITASALITALTAINLHGGAAFALRVLTLVLSASVTVVTAFLELFQVNHRWRLYRQLRNRLENIGWQTATRGGTAASPLLADLGRDFIKAMNAFERSYISQVASVSETEEDAPPENHRQARREQQHKPD